MALIISAVSLVSVGVYGVCVCVCFFFLGGGGGLHLCNDVLWHVTEHLTTLHYHDYYSPRAKVEKDASFMSFLAIVCQHLFEACNGCTLP